MSGGTAVRFSCSVDGGCSCTPGAVRLVVEDEVVVGAHLAARGHQQRREVDQRCRGDLDHGLRAGDRGVGPFAEYLSHGRQPSGHDQLCAALRTPDQPPRVAVISHLEDAFGPHSGKGSVTFLGTETIDVLRFGPAPDGL